MSSIISGLTNKSGVFVTVSKTTGKFFIGSSYDLARAKREFFNKFLTYHREDQTALGELIRKTNRSEFVFGVLSFCSSEDLIKKRDYFITLCDNYVQGFNYDKLKTKWSLRTTICVSCSVNFNYSAPTVPKYCSWSCRVTDINKNRIVKRQKSIKETLKSICTGAISRAKRRKMPCDMDFGFLWSLYKKQKGKCAVTGIKLKPSNCIGRIRTDPNTITIDRIDSNKGYTRDNIQLTTMIYNTAKSNFQHKDVMQMVKGILKVSNL